MGYILAALRRYTMGVDKLIPLWRFTATYVELSTFVIKVAGFLGTRLFAVGRPFEGRVMAKSQSPSDFRNFILARLSPQLLDSLRPHLRPIELKVKQVICQPNQPIEYAYFVETGMISVVSIMEDGEASKSALSEGKA